MPAAPDATPSRGVLVKAAVVLVAAVAVLVLLLKGVHLGALIGQAGDWVARVGPGAYFLAMAVLPAFGVPATVFTFTAGPAFGPRLGMGWVIAAGTAAISVNIALTYWIARCLLRTWVERLVARLGYRMPEVENADMTDLIVIFRVTPGIPLFVQNYLLGLADAPVVRYLVISYIISWPMTTAYIWFGDTLRRGKGGMILAALGAIVALAAATHVLRRHYASRKAAG